MMRLHSFLGVGLAILIPTLGLQGCSGETRSSSDASNETVTEVGMLQLQANGEDFVRQGFTSKDGWQIQFDHVYVNLVQVTAYQTDPPYDPQAEMTLAPTQEVVLLDAKTVDLAEGDENAEPILVNEVEAPAGRYNALAWQMAPSADSGQTLVLVGTATKEGRTIHFTLQFNDDYSYLCGDFVGDERKGILQSGGTASLETTLHFDHIFGDGTAPAEDDINTGALGFEPLLPLAEGDQLTVDQATLKERLSADDYATLEAMLLSLGHVGEGHCSELGAS